MECEPWEGARGSPVKEKRSWLGIWTPDVRGLAHPRAGPSSPPGRCSQLEPGGWEKVRLRFELSREAQRICDPQMLYPTGQNVLLPWLGLVLGSWLLWAQEG